MIDSVERVCKYIRREIKEFPRFNSDGSNRPRCVSGKCPLGLIEGSRCKDPPSLEAYENYKRKYKRGRITQYDFAKFIAWWDGNFSGLSIEEKEKRLRGK